MYTKTQHTAYYYTSQTTSHTISVYLYTYEIVRVLRQSELNSRVHLELHAYQYFIIFYVCTINLFIIILYVCAIFFFLFLSFTAI